MLLNYLKLGFRNLIRRKVYSLISIVGLSVGLTTAFVVLAYVLFEGNYNRGVTDCDRIYRVMAKNRTFGHNQSMLPYIFGDQIVQDLPGLEAMTRFFMLNDISIKVGDDIITGKGGYAVDTCVFSVFGMHILEKGIGRLLEAPNTVAISKSQADKLFPHGDPLGKQLSVVILGNVKLFTITGVFEDLPDNTTVKFSYLFNVESVVEFYRENWPNTKEGDPWMRELLTKYDAAFSEFYIKFKPNTEISNVQKSLSDIEHRYLDKSSDRGMRGNLDLYLLSFTKSYYYTTEGLYDYSEKGNISLLYLLLFSGFFILFIGVSSYVILFTALSTLRFKEIGLRKVVGAQRRSLLLQSVTEAVLTCAVSLIPTFMLIEFIRPMVNAFSGKTIIGHYWSNPMLIGGFLLLVLLIGLIAGLYTAWGIMRFNPIEAIKGGVAKVKTKSRIRFVLVVLQLTIFIALTVATMVFKAQVQYVTRLGVRESGRNLLLVSLNTKPLQDAYPMLKQELKKIPWVLQTSGSFLIPPSRSTFVMNLSDDKGTENDILFRGLYVDAGFAELLSMQLLEGSYITGSDQGGGSPMLITEKAAKLFKSDKIIGYKCGYGTVVGIVKSFPTESARNAEEPLLILYNPDMVRWLAIKVDGNASADRRAQIAQLIKSKVPDVTPSVITMEEHVAELYRNETMLSQLLSLVALISISLAIMGLFGLSLFTLEQRTKEIGIRKISGASTFTILKLLFREYAWLVLAALVLAIPLSWFLLQKWLNTYAYHTAIHGWYYLVAALLALALVLLSILYQALRVARRNPVESLRAE